MIPLNIKLEDSKGITLLSNTFIDQYMRDANDAQIKIYLYLLRMVSANLPTDISEIADKFNHTEKDVIRSLKYWDNLGLISLSYDDNNNIAGVTFKNASGNTASSNPVKKTVTESPVSKEIPMISMDYAAERGIPMEDMGNQVNTEEFDKYVQERNHVVPVENQANMASPEYMRGLLNDVMDAFKCCKPVFWKTT